MRDIPFLQLSDNWRLASDPLQWVVQRRGSAPLAQQVGKGCGLLVVSLFEATRLCATVHVFDLEGHPEATRAYAWSSPMEGSTKRRFFAVLHMGGIRSPQDAVRAAIVAERKAQ